MMQPIAPGELLTAPQLAQALKMSETWVREKARDCKMPHYWFEGMYRFDLEEVRGWLESFHRGPKVERVIASTTEGSQS